MSILPPKTPEKQNQEIFENDLRNMIEFYCKFLSVTELTILQNLARSLAQNYSSKYKNHLNK